MRTILLLLSLAIGLLGCSQPADEPCQAGTSLGCTCTDGREGTALCEADGFRFGACSCTGPCREGTTRTCACPNGVGLESCQAGSFGSCACPAACQPGTLSKCACGADLQGLRACLPDGSGYGSCECPQETCSPGATVRCQCADGAEGQAACDASGKALDCRCDVELCNPGSASLCRCEGAPGLASCNPRGTAFGACICSGSLPCALGSKAACQCPDQRFGFAACLADGSGFGACACDQASCVPGKERACACSEGRTGLSTCNASGTAWSACACAPECGGAVSAQGALRTLTGQIDFQGPATATLVHSVQSDPSLDGCLSTATFTLLNTGCVLTISFGPVGTAGGLRRVELAADAQCPGFGSQGAGTYVTRGDFLPAWFTGPLSVPGRFAQRSCLPGATFGFPDRWIPLFRADGTRLDVNLSSLQLRGDVRSTGDYQLGCTPHDDCGMKRDGGDGWCTTYCIDGFHNGGDFTCVAMGTCAAGYHLGANGSDCLAPSCPQGQHDGGDGTCTPADQCAPGHALIQGFCRKPATCPPLLHDDGNRTCVPPGLCAADRHDDGSGLCAQTGCRSGFHDGGLGPCVPAGRCSPGYVLDASGACIGFALSCGAGLHFDGVDQCVPLGVCAGGYHDDGGGRCVPEGQCAAGRHLDEKGTCVTSGGCAPGLRDDGTGRCATTCAAGFHESGTQTCVALGTCSPWFGLDDLGNCAGWVATAGPPVALDRLFALPNGKVLGLGPTPQLYDPQAQTWSPVAAPPVPLISSSASLAGDKLHGLRSDGRVAVLDTTTLDWTELPPTVDDGKGIDCVVGLADGGTFVAGGASFEVFDPVTGAWTRRPAPFHLYQSTCLQLSDGRVALAGYELVLIQPHTGEWVWLPMMPKTGFGYWLRLELEPGRLLLGESFDLLHLVSLHTGVLRSVGEIPSAPYPFVHNGHVVWATYDGDLFFMEVTTLKRVHSSQRPLPSVDHYGTAPLPDGRILLVVGTQAFLSLGKP